jgi:hypothetical protein
MIHESSVGLLRDIDRLGTDCLKQAAKRKLKTVDRELVLGLIETQDSLRHSA